MSCGGRARRSSRGREICAVRYAPARTDGFRCRCSTSTASFPSPCRCNTNGSPKRRILPCRRRPPDVPAAAPARSRIARLCGRLRALCAAWLRRYLYIMTPLRSRRRLSSFRASGCTTASCRRRHRVREARRRPWLRSACRRDKRVWSIWPLRNRAARACGGSLCRKP